MSITSKAMLVSISIGVWSGRKLDKKETAKLNESHGAKSDAARVTKSLVSKTALADIMRISDKARGILYNGTLPWQDNGTRILSAVGYLEFTKAIREVRDEFQQAVERFVSGYDDFRAQAEIDLNGMFNGADYPPASHIRARFRFPRPAIWPIPQAADFRVEIGETEIAEARDAIESQLAETIRAAQGDAFRRIAKVVGHMAATLKEYKPSAGKGDKAAATFRDSLVSNVADLVDVLPSLNFTGDAKLAEITERMRELCAADATVLRKHADVRKDVADKAAAIAAEVEAYF